MANVNATVVEVVPQGGADLSGRKLGYLASTVKAAENDTITVTNAQEVEHIAPVIVATGAFETHTISANVITLTSATTGSVKGFVYFR